MRTPTVIAALVLLLAAPAARAGEPIKTSPDCPDQDLAYAKQDSGRYRTAVLCLIGAVRRDQKLNPLAASSKLATAGRRWAARQAKTGHVDHGPSVAAIPKRIARAGYRAAALNEGLGFGEPGATPYDVVSSMMLDYACTEILDPRFRDAGVGVSSGKLLPSLAGHGVHVVVEFGLAAGRHAPSHRTRPARTCGHRLPPAATPPVRPAPSPPTVHATDVTVSLVCAAKAACTFDATLKLTHDGSKSTQHVDGLAPGAATEVVFPLPADAIRAEQGSQDPGVDVTVTTTEPRASTTRFHSGI